MGGMDKLRKWLRTTYIGPIAAAILVHWGLYWIVEAIEFPVSAVTSQIVNTVVPVTTIVPNWTGTGMICAWGVVAGMAGLVFAHWLYRRAE